MSQKFKRNVSFFQTFQAAPVSDDVKQKMMADYQKYDQVLDEKKRQYREKNPDKYERVDQSEDEQNVFYKSLIGKQFVLVSLVKI